MNKASLIIALLFSCVSVVSGYADYSVDSNSAPSFDDYMQLFTFIAKIEGVPGDPNSLLKLAAESTMKSTGKLAPGQFVVVEAQYWKESSSSSRIRSHQNNGGYYVLLKKEKGFQLAGYLVGNRYRWRISGGRIRIIVNYHISVVANESIYQWNGRVFEVITPVAAVSDKK